MKKKSNFCDLVSIEVWVQKNSMLWIRVNWNRVKQESPVYPY